MSRVRSNSRNVQRVGLARTASEKSRGGRGEEASRQELHFGCLNGCARRGCRQPGREQDVGAATRKETCLWRVERRLRRGGLGEQNGGRSYTSAASAWVARSGSSSTWPRAKRLRGRKGSKPGGRVALEVSEVGGKLAVRGAEVWLNRVR